MNNKPLVLAISVVFVLLMVYSIGPSITGNLLWGWNHCSTTNPCPAGEGDCDKDSECQTGYCADNVGSKYGQTRSMDVCENRPGTTTGGGGGGVVSSTWSVDYNFDIVACGAINNEGALTMTATFDGKNETFIVIKNRYKSLSNGLVVHLKEVDCNSKKAEIDILPNVPNIAVCGDGVCDSGEYYCPDDCGFFRAHWSNTTTISYKGTSYDVSVNGLCTDSKIMLSFNYDNKAETVMVAQGEEFSLMNFLKLKLNTVPCSVDFVTIEVIGFDYSTTTCTETDGGIDYYNFGIATVPGVNETWKAADICMYSTEKDKIVLHEYYCDGTLIKTDVYDCPNGCNTTAGACISNNVSFTDYKFGYCGPSVINPSTGYFDCYSLTDATSEIESQDGIGVTISETASPTLILANLNKNYGKLFVKGKANSYQLQEKLCIRVRSDLDDDTIYETVVTEKCFYNVSFNDAIEFSFDVDSSEPLMFHPSSGVMSVDFIGYIDSSCHTKPLWDWSYCTDTCPCDAGEGDCDRDSQCTTGYCARNVGTKYGQTASMDVCE